MRPFILAVACLAAAGCGPDVHEHPLASGYVACETGRQLRWFLDMPDVDKLSKLHSRPGELPIAIRGDTALPDDARKALERKSCLPSEYVEGRLDTVESCDADLHYPNGGCRRIKVDGNEWYTFGDAVPNH